MNVQIATQDLDIDSAIHMSGWHSLTSFHDLQRGFYASVQLLDAPYWIAAGSSLSIGGSRSILRAGT